eukprot:233412-Alexandrium_andersonii.AAC.1
MGRRMGAPRAGGPCLGLARHFASPGVPTGSHARPSGPPCGSLVFPAPRAHTCGLCPALGPGRAPGPVLSPVLTATCA